MIPPIIAMQSSQSVASIQQSKDGQNVLQSQNAFQQVKEETRQVKETVVQKEEAVFYQQRHDAKEEGKNKYENLYSNKKKKNKNDEDKPISTLGISRVNFDIKV
ncbi:MAG: hypothetical protein IKL53_04505 [Lachnospiraceae bacterium]|nr:hypothetical protein [Lachnospiraceae bacterium]MBR3599122.1 hypothetical protein [Lachnospiraceae bacterium]